MPRKFKDSEEDLILEDLYQKNQIDKSKSKDKYKWQRITQIVGICFLLPILIFAFMCSLSMVISRKTKGVPLVFGYALITISSGSMKDAGFEVGDKAFIKTKNIKDYKIGDYIAFFDYVDPNCSSPQNVTKECKPSSKASTSRIVFHEIIEIRKDVNGKNWYITKGTNNQTIDGNIIYQEYIIGEFVKTSHSFISFITFATSIKGVLLFVVLPCGIIVFKDCMTLINIAFEVYESKKKKDN